MNWDITYLHFKEISRLLKNTNFEVLCLISLTLLLLKMLKIPTRFLSLFALSVPFIVAFCMA